MVGSEGRAWNVLMFSGYFIVSLNLPYSVLNIERATGILLFTNE